MKCVVWRGQWNTTKTSTFEMAIGTKHGIMSIRAIENRGRRQIDVFTGFDPIRRDIDEFGNVSDGLIYSESTELPLSTDHEFWEHRYIGSIEKSAKKWQGGHRQDDPCDLDEALDKIDDAFMYPVQEYVLAGAGKTHWEMLWGTIPGVSSSPRDSAKAGDQIAAKQQLKVAREVAAQSEFERRAAEDALFGIF